MENILTDVSTKYKENKSFENNYLVQSYKRTNYHWFEI